MSRIGKLTDISVQENRILDIVNLGTDPTIIFTDSLNFRHRQSAKIVGIRLGPGSQNQTVILGRMPCMQIMYIFTKVNVFGKWKRYE